MKSLVIALWVALTLLCCASRVEAQALSFAPEASTGPVDSSGKTLFSRADVELNGVPLFRVAVRADLKNGEISALNRALLVEQVLHQLTAIDRNGKPLYDASTLRVTTHHDGDIITIEATDARHSVPLAIVNVTSADAKDQLSTTDAIASLWQETLQNSLVQELRKLEPEVEKQHLTHVAAIAVALTIATTLLLVLLSGLQRRSRLLHHELTEGKELREGESMRDYDSALRRARTMHQLRVLSSASGVLVWVAVLAWFIAAAWSLGQFSQTTALSRDFSRGGTTIGIIWIGAAAINRLFDLAIARAATTWKIHHYLSSEEQARILLRIPTASSAVGHFKTFAIVAAAAFLTLAQLGLPVNSVVTIGGVAALAVTFAAQNFLRDVAGGVMVLYEDQYAIGDLVTINGYTGIVERVTLRIVMIRDTSGSAVTISHSAVNSVANFSRIWSRIDYQLSISPNADPDKAIEVVRETIDELARDPDAGSGLLLPTEWIGVHAFTEAWTLIRASIRTAPLQQSALRREINGRVRRRLAEAGIPYGPPIDPMYIPLL